MEIQISVKWILKTNLVSHNKRGRVEQEAVGREGDQKAKNRLNVRLHEKFHRGILKGYRNIWNISDTVLGRRSGIPSLAWEEDQVWCNFSLSLIVETVLGR